MGTFDEEEFKEPQTPEEAQAAFEHLFDEMIDLLQATADNIDSMPETLPEELEKKISKLEKDVALFQQVAHSLGKDPDITEEKKPKLTRREEASIARAEKAISHAEEQKKKLPQKPPTGPSEIQDDTQRRKHFKRLGRKKI